MELNRKQRRAVRMVIAYPFAIFFLSVSINLLLLDIGLFQVAMPSKNHVLALVVLSVFLTVNHSLLMTTTELVRVKHKMFATPEEWEASGTNLSDIPKNAVQELERNHNAHRNCTENTCYFIVLVIPFLCISPPIITTYVWLVGFALSRVGHTYAYLTGKDNLRGMFMSFSLIAMYGVVSYLCFSIFDFASLEF